MADYLDLRRVFIASPGDLNAERELFRQVIQEVNSIKARSMGIYLEPLGWEDTLPGRGRPQELINADIARSDLVIVVLWKRWGTPTGKYSSGVEEEFELAKRFNRERGGRPHILLYFKAIPPDMLADPGEQLRQVLTFRQSVEEARELFFAQFGSAEQWPDLLRDHVCRWLDERSLILSTPSTIAFPNELTERMSQLTDRLEALQLDSELRNASQAAELGRAAMDAAISGRLTEAQRLFATSLSIYRHTETIAAYVMLMEDIGHYDLVPRDVRETSTPITLADTARSFALLGDYYARRGEHILATEK